MRRRAVLLLITLSAPLPAAAGSGEIEGAFGLRFGQVLDMSGHPEPDVVATGGLRVAYRPENPYAPLSDYTVTVTPETHRVYEVRGLGQFKSMRRCREELVTLEGVLEKKYVKTSDKVSERFGDIPEIRFGESSRKIHGQCVGGILNKRLVLIYIDEALSEEARREARRAAAGARGQRDTSGL